jgi:hypothetical protein
MSGTAGSNRLNHAIKTLRVHWDETEAHWRDAVRREFEEHHVEPLESQVETTLRAMQRLGEVLARLRRDCADRSSDY